jgi:membrane fusion protein (multidrug efflux system)
VERRAVITGYASGDRVEIVEGLEGDEEIVVVGQSGLRDGSRVEVVRRAPSRLAGDAL